MDTVSVLVGVNREHRINWLRIFALLTCVCVAGCTTSDGGVLYPVIGLGFVKTLPGSSTITEYSTENYAARTEFVGVAISSTPNFRGLIAGYSVVQTVSVDPASEVIVEVEHREDRLSATVQSVRGAIAQE